MSEKSDSTSGTPSEKEIQNDRFKIRVRVMNSILEVNIRRSDEVYFRDGAKLADGKYAGYVGAYQGEKTGIDDRYFMKLTALDLAMRCVKYEAEKEELRKKLEDLESSINKVLK